MARSAGSWELRARLRIPSIWATSACAPLAEGRLSRIAGIDGQGARMIEVWRSSDDAQAFARQSAPQLAAAPMPPPSRVVGFEVTDYVVA
jgi:hypothetical protein